MNANVITLEYLIALIYSHAKYTGMLRVQELHLYKLAMISII